MHGSPSRGQATLGFALIVGIALIGVVTVVTLGATALTDIRTNAATGAAEQAMTQFDSQTAQVALGDSAVQTVSVGRTEGSYEVDPDAGYVKVVHVNFDGKMQNDGDDVAGSSPNGTDDDEILYESTLGTVRYQRGGTIIGYQAGGVWEQTGNGQGRMVSPPEFHYRGSTLTFPVVRVNNKSELPAGSSGIQSGSGAIDLQITQLDESEDIFPTKQRGYPDTDGDGDGGYYQNPATNGTVIVYIESEFYQAWANYFQQRTDGTVDTSDTPSGMVGTDADPQGDGTNDEGVVAVKLVSTGFDGPFTMPGDGSSIMLQGIDDHSMSDFDITLVPDNSDSANLNNLQWSMYVKDGTKEFEVNVRKVTGGDCDSQEFIVTVFYSPKGTDDYHGWQADGVTGSCTDVDGDGDQETRLTIDFVDDEDDDDVVSQRADSGESDLSLTYQSLSQRDLTHFGLDGRNLKSSITFDEHESAVSWEPRSYSTSDSEDNEYIDGVINHYFSLLGPGFDLTVDDWRSNTVNERGSSGHIEYTGGSQFVTYIHLSENDVRVAIN